MIIKGGSRAGPGQLAAHLQRTDTNERVELLQLDSGIDDLAAKNVFRPFLEAPERYTFLSQELVDAGESSYILIPGVIDHILVTHDALDEYGPGHTEPVMLDQTYPDYVRNVSDHRPVRATFVIR